MVPWEAILRGSGSPPALADYLYVLSGRVRARARDPRLNPSLVERYVRDTQQLIVAQLRAECRRLDEFLHDAVNRPPDFVRHDAIRIRTDELDPRLVDDGEARGQIAAQLYGFVSGRLGFHGVRVEAGGESRDHFRVHIPMYDDLCRSRAEAVKDRYAQKSGLPNEIDQLPSS